VDMRAMMILDVDKINDMKQKQTTQILLISIALLILTNIIIYATENKNTDQGNEARQNRLYPIEDRISSEENNDIGAGKSETGAMELCTLEDVICPGEATIKEITAYSELDSCHTGESCLMANGEKAHINALACPRDMKLGSKIGIIGLGEFTCDDRTAKWVDGRFDLFLGYGEEAHERAINFGVKKLLVLN